MVFFVPMVFVVAPRVALAKRQATLGPELEQKETCVLDADTRFSNVDHCTVTVPSIGRVSQPSPADADNAPWFR